MTFRVPLSELLAAQNAKALEHVERTHGRLICQYANRPQSTAQPVRVRKDLRIVKGFRRVLAAKLRGDADVLCCPATPQEEMSAN